MATKVLIVDDNEAFCSSLTDILEAKGYEVESAGTGREAIEKAQGRFFNVALLDIRLPGMDGMKLLTTMKKMHPDMAVIMTTAYASLETAVEALEEGAAAYIIKPLKMDEVLTTVSQLVEKQRLEMENRRLYQEIKQELAERKKAEEKLKKAYNDLKKTQVQLIQSEKMEAIGGKEVNIDGSKR